MPAACWWTCLWVGSATALVTNINNVVPDAVVPHPLAVEDTSMVAVKSVSEAFLSCSENNQVNRPVFCKVAVYDSCSNPANNGVTATDYTPHVTLLAGNAAKYVDLTTDAVRGSDNVVRFHFTPIIVGVYEISVVVSAGLALVKAPDTKIVVVNDVVELCTHYPLVDTARTLLQAHTLYHDLELPRKQWRSRTTYAADAKNIDTQVSITQELAARVAAEQNVLLNKVRSRTTTQLPRMDGSGYSSLFAYTDPPPDTFPKSQDAFCQTIIRSNTDPSA
ncbi:hypothetical protein DIPPA_70080 [Diplonema papillatum]|nr:hypothetical protein DIPPA_70080 [Diplonema papillatum]